jgi:hypothetical protein
MGKPEEICERCAKVIKGKMVACLFEGRVLCLPCDKAARAEQKRQENGLAAAAREREKSVAQERERERRRADRESLRLEAIRRPREFYSKIAGVTHRNSDGVDRQYLIGFLRVGQPLTLLREPGNRHSQTAVMVLLEGRYQLGYLPDHTSMEVAESMDHGVPACAFVTEVTGGTSDAPTRGVNLLVRIGG